MKPKKKPYPIPTMTPPPTEKLKREDPWKYGQSRAGLLQCRVNRSNEEKWVESFAEFLESLGGEETWRLFPVDKDKKPKAKSLAQWVFLITGIEFEDILDRIRTINPEIDVERFRVTQAKADAELVKHGGDRRSEDFKHDHIMLEKEKQGTSSSYLLRRIARDQPEILDRYEAGEFPSVRQAAIAAGIVKVLSPVEKVVSGFGRLSFEDKKEALAKIDALWQEE